MAALRRKVITYGKRQNKGHDLFSHLQPEDDAVRAPNESKISSPKLDPSPLFVHDQGDSKMFELPSSDEDDQLSESHRKRRKLTPVSKEKRPVKGAGNDQSSSVTSTLKKNSPKPGQIVSSNQTPGDLSKKVAPRQTTKFSGSRVSAQPAKSPRLRTAFSSPSVSPVTSAASRSPSQHLLTPPRQRSELDDPMTFTAPSTASIPTPKQTPRQTKRLQTFLDEKGVPDSPSRLGLSRLQLKSANASPDESSSDLEPDSKPTVSGSSKLKAPSMSRTRLIDSLGPMQSLPGNGKLVGGSVGEHNGGDVEIDTVLEEKEEDKKISTAFSSSSDTAAQQVSSSQSVPSSGPKHTYGKQRSYLSDMVNEIELPDAGSSSQRNNPSFNNQADSFDFPDMDEDSGAGGIRSIHELRKAGEAVRFQESLDTIFEDISSSSRSRKIMGYTQLSKRLQDTAFCTQFITSAMDRRLEKISTSEKTTAVRGSGDSSAAENSILETTLHSVVSAWMLSDSQATSRIIQSTWATMIPKLLPLLRSETALDVIASNRGQNISKITRKDITAFQSDLLQSRLWEGLERPTVFSPQLAALRLIETSVLRMKEFDDSGLRLPLPMLECLVDLLLHHTTAIELGPSEICRLELLVNILESYTMRITSLDEPHLKVLSRLAELGPLLELLSSGFNDRYRQVQHLLLRLTLNITNSNPLLCDTFAQAPLVSAIVKIILRDFIHLTPTGVAQRVETDTVILSLGTAINFAEMSGSARKIMAQTPVEQPRTYLQQLCTLFLSNLETASSTVGEGQDLVAFGYLAVLLCTMCVDRKCLQAIQEQFPRQDVGPLRRALQDFLKHFKKVEEEVDMEYHDFTARFERVLAKMDHTAASQANH